MTSPRVADAISEGPTTLCLLAVGPSKRLVRTSIEMRIPPLAASGDPMPSRHSVSTVNQDEFVQDHILAITLARHKQLVE